MQLDHRGPNAYKGIRIPATCWGPLEEAVLLEARGGTQLPGTLLGLVGDHTGRTLAQHVVGVPQQLGAAVGASQSF